jgi:hypothetical protein
MKKIAFLIFTSLSFIHARQDYKEMLENAIVDTNEQDVDRLLKRVSSLSADELKRTFELSADVVEQSLVLPRRPHEALGMIFFGWAALSNMAMAGLYYYNDGFKNHVVRALFGDASDKVVKAGMALSAVYAVLIARFMYAPYSRLARAQAIKQKLEMAYNNIRK